ncbi:MAG: rubrerythrin [Solirubrobacterales bacterium]
MNLKGSKTEANLKEAFAGESMARNKYTYFASVAKKEGYEQIAAIFLETAENEKEHAKLEYKLLNELGSTIDNLKTAASGENHEHTSMYPAFARIAREEGFAEIAEMFEGIARVEADHEKRYLALLERVQAGDVFKREENTRWKCRNCGYVHEGPDAPDLCPVCKHPQAYYEVECTCY